MIDLFKDCGGIKNVNIPEDRLTSKKRGFAFVTLDTDKAARKGLNYDGHKVMNRPLKVTLADPAKQKRYQSGGPHHTDKDDDKYRDDRNRPSRRDDYRRVKRRRSRSRSGEREYRRHSRRRSPSKSESPATLRRRDKIREKRHKLDDKPRGKANVSSDEQIRKEKANEGKVEKHNAASSNTSSDFEECPYKVL